MSKFFIDRPIFAWVIAIIVMIVGLIAMRSLPTNQYPEIAAPSVTIRANYPGASAETLENSVTQVIERNINGVDNLRYFTSSSSSSGDVTITVTFNQGTDPDIAQVQVQNRLQLAMPLLPLTVQQQGVSVAKGSSGFLMVVGFISKDNSLSDADLGDFVNTQIQDPISRVPGVGNIVAFGSPYAMRIWLNPEQLRNFRLNATDISAAILAQNAQVSAGQIGANPSPDGQVLNATITAQSRLQTVDEFKNIIIRANQDGSFVRLGQVARVELGAQSYGFNGHYNGQTAVGMGITLTTGANALDTADFVRARIEELRPTFPPSVDVIYPYDTTPFIQKSINSVYRTIVEAIILVFVVMYLFLQNWRSTLIPTIAVPVVLLGTFAVFAAVGYSINSLTMFGLVLSIGLLVDDAIVVVENVERLMVEENLSPREATRKSMDQITSPLVGIAIVVSMVFVPMIFFGGSTGEIYRQFSVTIIASMVLSLMVALILTPALCASLLKKPDTDPLQKKHFFGWFNRSLHKFTLGYGNVVGFSLKRMFGFLIAFIGVVAAMVFMFIRIPTAFLPHEDQGFLFSQVMLPANATTERTEALLGEVRRYFLEEQKDNVLSVFTVSGFSFSGNAQNVGTAFISLTNWDERTASNQSDQAILGQASNHFRQMDQGFVFLITPPPIPGMGTSSGFDMVLMDNVGLGHARLQQAQNDLMNAARVENVTLDGRSIRSTSLPDTPQFQIDLDMVKAQSLGLSINDINNTLSTALGGSYINDFLDRGRIKRVFVQADAQYRSQENSIMDWYVRNNQGEMVPFNAFATGRWSFGSPTLLRYNGLPSLGVNGAAAPGQSSGTAMQTMERLAASVLPQGITFDWTGLSYEERASGDQTLFLYSISLVIVFLCLAALYESWSVPTAIMLIVPLGIVGAVTGTFFRGLTNDVYFQVGLLTTVGLAAKNAILIVEFAKEQYHQGEDLIKASIHAAQLRLRPILMTSLTFIVGVLPLALATGAGSGGQRAIGTAVVGGMTSSTFLAIFFVPLFYVLITKITVKLFGDTRKKQIMDDQHHE